MSYIAPHQLKDGILHCPRTSVANRVSPSPHDSHQYACPSCKAVLVLRERSVVTVLRELVDVEALRARSA